MSNVAPAQQPVATAAASQVQPRFRSWPITEVQALEADLKKMGLKVPASEIDGTGGANAGSCLSDGLVSVGPAGRGGTGSFVSADGLILTNHHVALDAVRQASTTDSDYLKDGFVASSQQAEIAGPDYEVWITRSCKDVSEKLAAARSEKDPLKRANLVRDRRQEIAKEAEQESAGTAPAGALRCEVQEMWPDRTYVLFTYERLRDVRIVYVPPNALGNFGGDTDNFEWPRHTADFTLLRAYVGPDGSAAEPAPENVPYKPSKFLRVAADGASPGDFVFLLGFPGSTMRYAPASRLRYSDDVAVPGLIRDFGAKLALIAEHATERAVTLKLKSAQKGLANEYKRSVGKQVMMRKLGLIAERAAEEEKLCTHAPSAKAPLQRLAEIYDELRKNSVRSDALDALQGIYAGSTLMAVGHTLHEARVETKKPDSERESSYRERNIPFLVKRLSKRLTDLHAPHEAALILRAASIAADAKIDADLQAVEDAAAKLKEGSPTPIATLKADELKAMLSGEAPCLDDSFVHLAAKVYPAYVADRDLTKALMSERDKLLAELLEIQKAKAPEGETFYPDANGCLRLSAGHVEGYVAADAVMHQPVTTLAGLLDKHMERAISSVMSDEHEFVCPERLKQMCESSAVVRSTPVCICYSTDTVGGNSGSPVLNAQGQVVAINFDRQRLGLMNEFKWSIDYSRSIGTDTRYILWLVGEYDGAAWLVKEMTQ